MCDGKEDGPWLEHERVEKLEAIMRSTSKWLAGDLNLCGI